jgi:hypothetical protein
MLRMPQRRLPAGHAGRNKQQQMLLNPRSNQPEQHAAEVDNSSSRTALQMQTLMTCSSS